MVVRAGRWLALCCVPEPRNQSPARGGARRNRARRSCRQRSRHSLGAQSAGGGRTPGRRRATADARSRPFPRLQSALSNCRAMGGYWTGSSCRFPEARARDCGPGWIWDEFGGEFIFDGGGRAVCRHGNSDAAQLPVRHDLPRRQLAHLAARLSVMRLPARHRHLGRVSEFHLCVGLRASRRDRASPGIYPAASGADAAGRNLSGWTNRHAAELRRHTRCSLSRRPVGTPPNCRPAPASTCPAGQTGTPPNCVPRAAPRHVPPAKSERRRIARRPRRHLSGWSTGTPRIVSRFPLPRRDMSRRSNRHASELCHASASATCPAGQTGTPPNCVVRAAPNAPCAPWQTGTPGNCVDIQVTCTGGTVRRAVAHAHRNKGLGGGNNWQCVQPTCQGRRMAAGRGGTMPLQQSQSCADRDLAEFRVRGCRDASSYDVSGWSNGHASELRHATTTATRNISPRRVKRAHRPNCVAAPAATCPAGQTGTPPNCRGRDMSDRTNRNAAKLRRRNMSGRSNRHDHRIASRLRPRHVPLVRPAHRRIALRPPPAGGGGGHVRLDKRAHRRTATSCASRNMSDRSTSVRRRTARRAVRRVRRGKPERPAIASTFK